MRHRGGPIIGWARGEGSRPAGTADLSVFVCSRVVESRQGSNRRPSVGRGSSPRLRGPQRVTTQHSALAGQGPRRCGWARARHVIRLPYRSAIVAPAPLRTVCVPVWCLPACLPAGGCLLGRSWSLRPRPRARCPPVLLCYVGMYGAPPKRLARPAPVGHEGRGEHCTKHHAKRSIYLDHMRIKTFTTPYSNASTFTAKLNPNLRRLQERGGKSKNVDR
ncbi:hypothetical protein BO71DRAFT_176246 [Aspergillus ellipticus CBS 707.79]|uniref:Uncharacterized protein n=1 Tax=Aspergillus ellipticus CBS 707.79 TaxID=1448320 RepID=A0A319DG91_9EURO|nr:hypothetical protein BO71DRAFT_176246 [Aspergillus ellipticus CBS 707.79]